MRICSSGLDSSARAYAAFPLFAAAFIGRAYIIRSIQYLMAVSVSDVYLRFDRLHPRPAESSFLVEFYFSRASCARGCRFHRFHRFHRLSLRLRRSAPFSRSARPRRGEDIFFRSAALIVPHVNGHLIGRTSREAVLSRDERFGQVAVERGEGEGRGGGGGRQGARPIE